MKKSKAIILIVLVIALVSGFISFKIYANNKEKENARIARKYEKQNYAFGMPMEPFYKGYDDVHPIWLMACLYAFLEDTDNQTSITIKDIEAYLENEYDASGNLAVLNPPESIQMYIEWFWSEGGASYISDYIFWVDNYIDDHNDKYGYGYILSLNNEEDLERLIEDFDNCPDKEKYMPKALKR